MEQLTIAPSRRREDHLEDLLPSRARVALEHGACHGRRRQIWILRVIVLLIVCGRRRRVGTAHRASNSGGGPLVLGRQHATHAQALSTQRFERRSFSRATAQSEGLRKTRVLRRELYVEELGCKIEAKPHRRGRGRGRAAGRGRRRGRRAGGSRVGVTCGELLKQPEPLECPKSLLMLGLRLARRSSP